MSLQENIRGRFKQRLDEVRSRVREIRPSSRMVGGGTIVNEIMNRADRMTARISERKPGLIPLVKEFRAGARLKKVLSPSVVDRGNMSIESDIADYAEHKDLSVVM